MEYLTVTFKTLQEAAKYVLEKNRGFPLFYKDIAKIIDEEKLYKKRPVKVSSVRRTLSGKKDLFEGRGHGKYVLRSKNAPLNTGRLEKPIEDNPAKIHRIEEERLDGLRAHSRNYPIKLYVTDELKKQIHNKDQYLEFCRGTKLVDQLLFDWYKKDFKCINEYCRLFYLGENIKVIFGTTEEVIKHRKMYRKSNTDKGILRDICKLKLDIINLLSGNEMCDLLTSSHTFDNKLEKLTEKCIEVQSQGRYAFYRPINCAKKIDVFPVLLPQYDNFNKDKFMLENEDNKICCIDPIFSSVESGFIMMPFDLDHESALVFTPKFYQALYHELYHLILYDLYRGSEYINEGLPELYSELCYDIFLKDFAYKRLQDDSKNNDFVQRYMKFRHQGAYRFYYNFVNTKLDNVLENNEKGPYYALRDFTINLINFSQDMLKSVEKEIKSPNRNLNREYRLLPCGKENKTPEWMFVFDKARIESEKERRNLF